MNQAKTPRDSAVETRYLVMPDQANAHGTVFGGTIMSWIDMVAAMVAQRHCGGVAVTASIDKISFKAPIYVGEHAVLKAAVNYVGTTSLEVGVQVTKENPYNGECIRATTAYLTFVYLDDHKKPQRVPPLRAETEDEIRRYRNAEIRVQARKELLGKLKQTELESTCK
ncbi:MAG TPA: acyl-CoA thioesterase [Bacillota bacterium]|nr:acyl-CoA thioesterase [Bacillota bacterium]